MAQGPLPCAVCAIMTAESAMVGCSKCNQGHRVCRTCYQRWNLGPLSDLKYWWPPLRLDTCPESDEFRVALILAD